MISQERAGYEFASQEELAHLWQSAHEALEAHGELILDEKAVVTGERYGIPVATHQPNWEFICYREALLRFAPLAVGVFKVTTALEVNFGLPYYQISPELSEEEYTEAFLSFTTLHASGDIPEHQLFMHASQEGAFESDRLTLGEIGEAPPIDVSPEKRIGEVLDAYGLEYSLGINRWTRQECQAMQQVIDALGEIKAWQDALVQ